MKRSCDAQQARLDPGCVGECSQALGSFKGDAGPVAVCSQLSGRTLAGVVEAKWGRARIEDHFLFS